MPDQSPGPQLQNLKQRPFQRLMLLGFAPPNLMKPAAAKAAHAAKAARAAKRVGRVMDVVRAPAVLGIRDAGKGVPWSGGLNLSRIGHPQVEVTVNGMTLIPVD